jgi:hypothetical protein
MNTEPKITPSTVLVTDLISDEKAIDLAEKLAKKLRKKLVVSDASGRQIWTADPHARLEGWEKLVVACGVYHSSILAQHHDRIVSFKDRAVPLDHRTYGAKRPRGYRRENPREALIPKPGGYRNVR